MKHDKAILLIGGCGAGKTWVAKQLINLLQLEQSAKVGLIRFRTKANEENIILGRYVGSVFDGSDKLSMAVAKDFDQLHQVATKHGFRIIAEGDRFMNSSFVAKFDPYIIKIEDDGSEGRRKRNSQQTERQIKTIKTRVTNTKHDMTVSDSAEALSAILNIIDT